MAEFQKDITEIQKENMLSYFMDIIFNRSISDIRDGLKPVHRRLLYSMLTETKATSDKPFKKAARCVSNCMGIYHPHGEASIFNAGVRLAQKFVSNIPLIDYHGAIGSISGDGAAASRYLELRLSKFSENMMEELDYNSVDFIPNYDTLTTEPTVIPVKTCLLLVNGSFGIVGGFSQSIPPHNVVDICSLIKRCLKQSEITLDDIADYLVPDFPTGGEIYFKNDIINAYKTGRGKIRIRAKIKTIEENNKIVLIATEIPYGTTTGPKVSSTTTNTEGGIISSIVKKILDGTITEIDDIEDHSADTKAEIRIYLKKNTQPDVVINKLYKYTLLETTFSIILLYKDQNKFKITNIKEIIDKWIEFRISTIRRSIVFKINKIKKRIHIIAGLFIVVNNSEEIVKLVKKTKDREQARIKLKEIYNLSDLQANAILDMKISQLTNLEKDKLIEEDKNKRIELVQLRESLSEENIKNQISNEQDEIIKKYGNKKNKTELITVNSDISYEDVITNEPTTVLLTTQNTIKRINTSNIKAQRRNTQGINIGTDNISKIFNTNLKDHLFCFTNTGKVFDLKVYEINEVSNIKSKGKNIISYLKLSENEIITNILCISNDDFNNDEAYLIFLTKHGIIKKTSLKQFSNIRSNGIIALNMKENDSLQCVKFIDIKNNKMQDIIVCSKDGLVARYDHTEVRETNRNTVGMVGLNLRDNDYIIGMDIINDEEKQQLFICTRKGLAKSVRITDIVEKTVGGDNTLINDGFPRLKRSSNIKGRKSIILNDGDNVVAIRIKDEDLNEALIVTDKKFLIADISSFNSIKRPTKGKILISLTDDDYVKNVILR